MSNTIQDSKPTPQSGSVFQLAGLFLFLILAVGVCVLGRNYYPKYLEDYEQQNARGLTVLDENRLEQAYLNKLRTELPENNSYPPLRTNPKR